MDIENFIQDTISQIMSGIHNKNKEEDTKEQFRLIKGINFDLAVTVSTGNTENSSIGGGGKIKIASIDAKKDKTSSEQNTVVSRVNFTIGQKAEWDF